jgi:hypothetical protein
MDSDIEDDFFPRWIIRLYRAPYVEDTNRDAPSGLPYGINRAAIEFVTQDSQ